MNSPLGMLAFEDTFGHMQNVEATEICRITDLREPQDNEGRKPTRCVVRLRGGIVIDSTNSAPMLIDKYHEIIRGTLPRLDAVERID